MIYILFVAAMLLVIYAASRPPSTADLARWEREAQTNQPLPASRYVLGIAIVVIALLIGGVL